jgi:hypothetical protein
LSSMRNSDGAVLSFTTGIESVNALGTRTIHKETLNLHVYDASVPGHTAQRATMWPAGAVDRKHGI